MIELKHNTRLVGARDEHNFPIRDYDDGDGPVWLFGHEHGVTMVIRARSFETAWEIMLDESPTISEDDVPEAYGFYGDNAAEDLRRAVEDAEDTGDYPELVEGYEMQPNCSGTGIVDVGHYAWLREYTAEDADKVRLVVRHDDEDQERVALEIESYAYTLRVRGKVKRFKSYSLLSDIGSRLRRLERAIGTVSVSQTWVNGC